MKLCLPLSLLVAASCFAASRAGSAPDDTGFRDVVQPFLAKNCAACHSTKLKTGGLDVQSFHSVADLQTHREMWENIIRKLSTGEMPPKGLPRPPQKDVKTVTQWIQTEFGRLDRMAPVDPGRVTARRLNRY